MFAGDCVIERRVLSVEAVATLIAGGVVSCCNPSHEATIKAMRSRFGLTVDIPATPPRVVLRPCESIIVMGVRGLPRLTDRHEYTDDEIARATFVFSEYFVQADPSASASPSGHADPSLTACNKSMGKSLFVV